MEKNFSNFNYLMKTEIVFGKETENEVGRLVKKYGGKKVLIVYGSERIKREGLYDRVTNSLRNNDIKYVELGGVQANPRLSLALKGVDLVKKESVDFILAVGGGSVIDTAKYIGLQMNYNGDAWDFFTGKAIPESIAPLGVIQTIAATGSETSGSAVIKDDIKTHTKYGNMFNHIRALFAIMNPELTYGVPKYQTGCGTVDILAHSFDSYFTYGTSYLGDRFSESTMRTAVKYGPIALNDPTNYEARAELLLANSFAHNDTCRIGRGKTYLTGGGHNLERHISGKYDTAHGAGLAVMMPAILEYCLEHDKSTIDKICQFGQNVFDVRIEPTDLYQGAKESIAAFRNWLKIMGMPKTLSELTNTSISDEDIKEFVDILGEPNNTDSYYPMFGHFNKKDVQAIYESVR